MMSTMNLGEQLLLTWHRAEADLRLHGRARLLEALVVVPDFGSHAGMVCSVESERLDDVVAAAKGLGAGYSMLGEMYLDYDRDMFIDLLDDWGWCGEGDPPSWYSGPSDD